MTFIKERGRECHHLISVCTGTFLLAEAGLISGKSVTTHWEFLEELAFYSDLHVEGEKRYIRDGDVWTAAGIYSGIDLALAFINSFEGTRAPNGQLRQGEAGIVQMIAQYFPSSERYHPGIHLAKGPDFIQAEFGTSDLKPKLF
jgi:transcriptional regulator GlxA family with amidase domain